MENYSQTRREEAKKSIEALNAAYNNKEMGYSTYLKKFKVLKSKFKSANSVANQMKDNGMKVTKNGGGCYFYDGRHFSVDIFLDGCVTDYWTIDVDTAYNQDLLDEFEGVKFDRKVDAIEALFNLDISMWLDCVSLYAKK